MKKLYRMMLAVAMIAAMALPVMASPSPEAETISLSESVTTPVKGVLPEEPSKELSDEVVRVTSNAQVLTDLNVSSSAHLAATIDVSFEGTIPAGGIQVPFNVSAFAKKGDLVYILHRRPFAPYQWEVVGQTIVGDDLTATGTFTSFSPVAFMVLDASQVKSAGVKSPKTGEY
ncbi:MAG: hypothetical protein NC331_04995 [Lachnospiraceae bacterium]|nr:hypothetical protein [Lachnospiraceae bacterium]MCM1238722.1 hypothetical protein [Lachnospiraceae bacterium]